MQENT